MNEDQNKLIGMTTTDGMFLDDLEETEEVKMEDLYVVVTNCKKLNVRAMPDKKFAIKEVVDAGSRLKVLSKSNTWYKVETESGAKGYVMVKYVEEV